MVKFREINQRLSCNTCMFSYQIIFPVGMNSLLFSALSAESNKKMILCVLCGSAVKMKCYT